VNLISSAIQWLRENYFELAGTLAGLLYIYYTIKKKNRLWVYGIISSGLYVYVFYHSGIYAYTLLYVYYVIIGVYGLYNWTRKTETGGGGSQYLSVKRIGSGKTAMYALASIVLSFVLFILIRSFGLTDAGYADSFLAASSIVATWMLTQKYMEHWLFWIVIDVLSMAFMIYKGLYPSSLLFLAYTLLAIRGYFEWKKEMIAETEKH